MNTESKSGETGDRMAKKRDIKLDEYSIGTFAYRELYNFCLQYPEMKRKLARCSTRGTMTEPLLQIEKACKMIEQTAIEAAGGNDYQCLLLAVTQDVPFHYLHMLKNLAAGRDKFYAMKRKFYYLLAKKKKII